MPPNTRRARLNSATSYVFALPELWALVAEHSGVVGAWRLTGVCRVAREGAKEWLRTLPGLVVCGGVTGGGEISSEVWRLDLGELRWERMPSLASGRYNPACCAVRGGVVVLGGRVVEADDDESESEEFLTAASVEILGFDDSDAVLPPLSRGPIEGSAAVAVDESESEQGQVLLIGGWDENRAISTAVHKVDLATGLCTPQPALLSHHGRLAGCSAARLPDGRIVCVGTKHQGGVDGAAQVLEPPEQGTSTRGASWQWRYLPAMMSVGRCYGEGCVLSDGRFAAFGGCDDNDRATRSCEVLTMDGDGERWEPLPQMREARDGFACAAIGGCVIVAGGVGLITSEVYEEALGRWRRLPCDIPCDANQFCWMGSALM
jgi:hypothetical protein